MSYKNLQYFNDFIKDNKCECVIEFNAGNNKFKISISKKNEKYHLFEDLWSEDENIDNLFYKFDLMCYNHSLDNIFKNRESLNEFNPLYSNE